MRELRSKVRNLCGQKTDSYHVVIGHQTTNVTFTTDALRERKMHPNKLQQVPHSVNVVDEEKRKKKNHQQPFFTDEN